jgi:hypothetical protein
MKQLLTFAPFYRKWCLPEPVFGTPITGAILALEVSMTSTSR